MFATSIGAKRLKPKQSHSPRFAQARTEFPALLEITSQERLSFIFIYNNSDKTGEQFVALER